MSDAPAWLASLLACPRCRAPLEREGSDHRCAGCGRVYPERFGIPDFRLEPDPHIGVREEEAKVRRLHAGAEGAGWRELVARYYAMTPENPPELHRRYVRSMERSVARGGGLLDRLTRAFPESRAGALLDLGCGTAGLAAAAAGRWSRVVGVDVALRWIVIGRQRLVEEGVRVPLLLANAEALPFREGAFDAVVADAVLEHVRRSAAMVDEAIRVLAPGGPFLFSTNNRYSLLPEPHVRLWGFGFLPRRWMEPVARGLRKTPYRAWLHGPSELTRVLGGRGRVALPDFAPGELGPDRERLRRIWERLRRFPPSRVLLSRFAPILYVEGRKPPSQS
ncbi:MAG: methyltransferase domain-containing protein [Gemmatimonadota bacterium]